MASDLPPEVKRYITHRWVLNPSRSALLVIDMQEYFRPLTSGIVENVGALLEAFRKARRPIIFTVHGHKDPEKDGGMLAKWWGEVILEGTFDHRLMGELDPREGERILPKRRYSAFWNTDLEPYLRAKGVEDLVLCGVMTNLCCETTARDAFMRDFRVFFVYDATATSSKDLQVASLMNLAYGFSVLVSTDEVLRTFGL